MVQLCSHRSEGFGPLSHRYTHSLTSCFLDTILVPLCTWLYLLLLAILFVLPARTRTSLKSIGRGPDIGNKELGDVQDAPTPSLWRPWSAHGKIYALFLTIYYLLIAAQFLMCVLETTRLSLAHLGIGLLPFIFVALITAAVVRLSIGLNGKIVGWRIANLGLWIMLAATHSVKVAEEAKELNGLGGKQRKGSKYMIVDELTDVGVMVGVYLALSILEASLDPY